MAKFYYPSFLLLAACFSCFIGSAQLSVTATEGTTGPVAYTSLKAAFDAINAGTHKGTITVTVTDNTTETATAVLKGSGSGAASYSSLSIRPAAGSNTALAGSVPNSLVVFDGARNVTIDGSNTAGGSSKNLSIINNSTEGSALTFLNGASQNTLKNVIFQSRIANSGVIVIGTSTAAAGNNNNTLEHNDITATADGSALFGIYNTGTAGKPNTENVFRHNRVYNFRYMGFRDGDDFGSAGYSSKTLLQGNEFFCTTNRPSHIIAIFLSNPTGITDMTITGNRIHSLTVGAFAEIVGIMLLDAASVTVDNNMIALSDPNCELRGISQETGAGANVRIYNNTILISGTTSSTLRSFAFFKNWFSTGDDIRNNMFINTRVSSGTGRQYAFIKIQPGTFTSNYNNLVSTGNALNYIGGSGTTDAPTLYQTFEQWKAGTGQDANSISVNPVFVSPTDLHLGTPGNGEIDNKGTPLPGITTDFDGEVRSTTTPDLGADEFNSTTTAVLLPDAMVSSVVLMPNVVNKRAVLRVRAAGATHISWSIVDMKGVQVRAFSSQVRPGVNDRELNLEGLSTGLYQLVGRTSRGRTEIIRLVKL